MENNTKAKVYNLIILDKSGSMSSIAGAAIKGFNETLRGVREAHGQYAETQEHFVSLLTFCSCSRNYVYECTRVQAVRDLEPRDYNPCCGTPLYDAMGKGINDLFKKVKDVAGATVVVTIITDGMENSSHEYSGQDIKALVEKMQKEYDWQFSYIGTNQDVESVAMSLSISETMYFEDTESGMFDAWEKERKARHRMYSRMNESMEENAGMEYSKRMEMMRRRLSESSKYQEIGEFAHRVTPYNVKYLMGNQIFVFGSNEQGTHLGGAARLAVERFGAIVGQGEGLQGYSYAIPTMEGIEAMREKINNFVHFAKEHPEMTFLVTRIGCGIAGYTPRQVAPLFASAVDVENIWLPLDFWNELV